MIAADQSSMSLPPDVYKLIRDMLYDHCGVWLDDESRFFVEGRLQGMLRRRRFTSFKDLYYYLKYDAARTDEFVVLVDLLTIHETYFFREDHQLRALIDEIVPDLMKQRDDHTLRIWSAGCSTGEEVYSIAMLLAEQPALADWRVEISGSDISQRVLATARRGVYSESAFRAAPPDLQARYFHREENGYRIDDSIKRRVNFFSFNLAEGERAALLPKMDVIFCRNVIIYFDQPVKKRVMDMFWQRLRPDGYLLLGHSESLMNITTAFHLCHLRQGIVYQKKEPNGGRPEA